MKQIPRKTVTRQDIAQVGKVNIQYFTSHNTGKLPLSFQELRTMEVSDPTRHIDILWEASFLMRPTRTAWTGVMQTIRQGTHPGKASVLFLPMIDMNASDMSCIYSTLYFVCRQAKQCGVTPILTFDQPLYWKASMIQLVESTGSCVKSAVIILGGLHLQMSFLSSIGHLMGGSGLKDVFETIYAANSVKHMLTGKAISCTIQ